MKTLIEICDRIDAADPITTGIIFISLIFLVFLIVSARDGRS